MNNSVFNTVFEVSLRVLLILEASSAPKTHGMIAAIDFISVFGKDFDVSADNLHGNNSYRYDEWTLRLARVGEAVNNLALSGLLNASFTKNGLTYSLSGKGKKAVAKFSSAYATEYKAIVPKTVAYIGRKTERAIIKEITDRSIGTMNGGQNA